MPNSKIYNSFPSSRVSAFQTGKTGLSSLFDLSAGRPIGLLLVLTYAGDLVSGGLTEFRPVSRISNTITNNRIMSN